MRAVLFEGLLLAVRHPCRVNAELNGDVWDVDASVFGRGEKSKNHLGKSLRVTIARYRMSKLREMHWEQKPREYEPAAKGVAILRDGGSNSYFQDAWIHA